jgi:hypothetical protein
MRQRIVLANWEQLASFIGCELLIRNAGRWVPTSPAAGGVGRRLVFFVHGDDSGYLFRFLNKI